MREVNQAGVDLIKAFEGLVDGDRRTVNLDPYADPIGILTIGWGSALTYGERFLRNTPADRALAKKMYPNGITRQEAEELLKHDIKEHVRDILHLIKKPLNDNQFAAVASLAFNIGATNFKKSSVLTYINRGDYKTAADRFLLWNKAGGRVLAGLTRRRKAERELFLTPTSTTTTNNERPLLKRGSRGEVVKEMQRLLGIKADGIFGPKTQQRVESFQYARGLTVDGLVGKNTWAALETC